MRGLEVSLSDLLKDQLIERQVRYSTTQPRVLLLQVLQSLGLIDPQTAILTTPAVITLLRHPETTTDQTDLLTLRQTHLNLPQKANNLFGCVTLPAHTFLFLWSSD